MCREFQRGNCSRGETDCRFAHPSDSPMIDSTDNTVTVCMDYVKSRCSREKCKYFHPPAHLQARLKSSQSTQSTAATAAMVRLSEHTCIHTYYILYIGLRTSHCFVCTPTDINICSKKDSKPALKTLLLLMI